MAELIISTTPDIFTAPFSFEANCLSSDAVGDCVYVSSDPVLGIEQVTKVDVTNKDKMPVRGMLVSKQSPTTCIVVYQGGITVTGPLISGAAVFVGNNSRPSATRPTSPAFVQIIGFASTPTQLFLNPSQNMIYSP